MYKDGIYGYDMVQNPLRGFLLNWPFLRAVGRPVILTDTLLGIIVLIRTGMISGYETR